MLIGNWKMNLNETQSLALAEKLRTKFKKWKGPAIAVAPSFLYLKQVKEILAKTPVVLAGQDVAPTEKGSATGEISGRMLYEIGCRYAIVGHSERRIMLGETNEMILRKINLCYNNGLVPIVCVGETEEQKLAGQTASVLVEQLQSALAKVNGLPENDLIIAYEPVWAVNTEQYLDPAELCSIRLLVKRTIVNIFSESFYNEKVRFIYGGSVSSINAKDYWAADCSDGLLVGAASLDADEFYFIASAGLS